MYNMISFLSYGPFFSFLSPPSSSSSAFAYFIRFLINHFPLPRMCPPIVLDGIIVRGAAGPWDSHLLYIKIVNRQNGRVWQS